MEETKPGVAAAAETATSTIGFVAVIEGKRLAPPQLRFVWFKLAANVATWGSAFRP